MPALSSMDSGSCPLFNVHDASKSVITRGAASIESGGDGSKDPARHGPGASSINLIQYKRLDKQRLSYPDAPSADWSPDHVSGLILRPAMYRARNVRVLELAALVLLLAPCGSVPAVPSPPPTAGLNEAEDLLGAVKLDEARALLRPRATAVLPMRTCSFTSYKRRPARRGSPRFRRTRAAPCRTKPSVRSAPY